VINIASIDGMNLNPLDTYSVPASKSALIYLTRRLACDAGAGADHRQLHRAGAVRPRT
jgi:NAD(P)-dependent dehydrogenase (short-subunit alcohol dehydrogenase family)